MAYDFYWISGSTNVWRVMLTLEYKGIPYNSHRLDASKKEHKSPAYLAMNPRGKVPTLKSGDTVIHESLAIMAFLECEHPTPALFGESAAETGLIWQRILETMNYNRYPIEEGLIFPLFRGEASTQPELLQTAASAVNESLIWIEEILGQQPFLAGSSPTAADIAAMPIFQMLARVGKYPDSLNLKLGFDSLSTTHPAISAWLLRLEALPGYEAAYPPHWKT
jgi:glutathione S-transferase